MIDAAPLWQHPFVNVVKIAKTGNKKLGIKKKGDVLDTIDKVIGKPVYKLSGSIPSNNTITIPSQAGHCLNLTGKYVYVYLRVQTKRYFVFHLSVLTKDDTYMKISFSNLYKGYKQTIKSIAIPCQFLPNDKWTVLAIDMEKFIKHKLGKTYQCLKSIECCASMTFRTVFTSDYIYSPDNLPKDMYLPVAKNSRWNDQYQWEWYPEQPFEYVSNQHVEPKIHPPTPTQSKKTTKKKKKRTTTRASRNKLAPRKLDMMGENENDDDTRSMMSETTVASSIGGDHKEGSAKALLQPDPILKSKQLIGFNGKYPSQLLYTNEDKYMIYTCASVIIVLNLKSREQRVFTGHTDEICAIAVNKQGTLLASVQQGKIPLMRLWEIETGRCVAILRVHHSDVTTIAISDTGNMLAAVGRDCHAKQIIVVWDTIDVLQSGKPSVIIKHPVVQQIERITFVPGEDTKMVTCGKQNIRFWRIRGGGLRGCSIATENLNLVKQDFLAMAFETSFINMVNNRTHRLYVATSMGSLYQINYQKRLIECIYQLHDGPIRSVYVNEGMCVTGSDDNFVRVWPLDFSDYFLEAEHESPVTNVEISKDGLQLVVGTESGSIGLLNLTTQNYQTMIRSHTSPILNVALDPHHPEFASVSSDHTIRVWNLNTFEQLYQFDTVGECPLSIAYHPMNYVFAVGFSSGIIRLFDISATTVIEEFRAHRQSVLDLHFAADGRWLISGSVDSLVISDCEHMYQPVKVWHYTETSESVSLAMSPNGLYLASAGPAGNMVHIYTVDTFEEMYTFETHSSDIFVNIEFSADNKEIVAITSDYRLIRLRLSDGSIVAERETIHRGLATTLSVSGNGQYLLTSGQDKILKIWAYQDFAKGKRPYQAFCGHSQAVNRVLFTNDGKYIISVGDDAIMVWQFQGNYEKNYDMMINNWVESKDNEVSDSDSDDETDSIIHQHQEAMPRPDFEGMIRKVNHMANTSINQSMDLNQSSILNENNISQQDTSIVFGNTKESRVIDATSPTPSVPLHAVVSPTPITEIPQPSSPLSEPKPSDSPERSFTEPHPSLGDDDENDDENEDYTMEPPTIPPLPIPNKKF